MYTSALVIAAAWPLLIEGAQLSDRLSKQEESYIQAQLSARLDDEHDDNTIGLAETQPNEGGVYGAVSSDKGVMKGSYENRFGAISNTSDPSSGGSMSYTAPRGTTAIKNMFLEFGPIVENAFGEGSKIDSLHKAIGYIDNAEDNALKGANMVLNGDREFTLEDAANLTASIPYVGDVVNILDKSVKLVRKFANFTDTDACYRLYWKPQYKKPKTTKTVKGTKDSTLLSKEVVHDYDDIDDGLSENYLELDYKRCDEGREAVFGFCAE